MNDPNRILKRLLSNKDAQFRELQDRLEGLEKKFCNEENEAEKQNIRKQIKDLRERVDARISLARSA